jgi:hypothetical protein
MSNQRMSNQQRPTLSTRLVLLFLKRRNGNEENSKLW